MCIRDRFGGQTPLNLASDLEKNGVKILGTSPAVKMCIRDSIYIIALTLSFMPQAVSQHLQALHREQISLLPAASPPVLSLIHI